MNCNDCKEKMWPENPEVGFTDPRTNRYYAPICQGCPHQEEMKVKPVPEQEWASGFFITDGQWGIIQQLQGEVRHIHQEMHEKKTQKKGSKYA